MKWPARAAVPALCAALLASCTDPAPPADPAETSELLARAPDALHEQPGSIEPGADGWGERGSGWEGSSVELAHGQTFVWAVEPRASLRISAGTPRERALEFTALGPRWRPETVLVALNGVTLDELELSREPSTHRLHAPEAAWQDGENLLEFETETARREEDGAEVAFALTRIGYDVPRRIVLEPGLRRATLLPGNSLCYRVALSARAQLVAAGRSRGRGSVALTRRWIDPASREELAPPITITFDSQDHEFRRGFQLDEPAGRTLEICVAWRSDGNSTLILTQLEIQDLVLTGASARGERVARASADL